VITRRIVVNLVAFALVSAALVAYGVIDLLGNPLRRAVTVSTVLPSAAGLSPNFLVTLDGVDVGTVRSVSLVPDGARITMTLRPGTRVPGDVAARVVIANALGEQEVQLVPQHGGTAAPLRSGAVVPAAPDSTPADVGTVVAEATRLLQAIPPGALDAVLHDVAVALDGQGANLRTIAEASRLFSQEFLASQQQFEQLLASAPPVLEVVSANATQLQQALADTAVLAEVLASHRQDLVRLLDQGTNAASDLRALVEENRPNLACLLHDLSAVNANVGTGANLHNLDTVLATNQEFFVPVGNLAPEGPAKALTSGDTNRTTQEWLRTRLLFPPAQPSADTYRQPVTLPPVLPGAGCDTEFGQGVGPGLQPGFTPVGPGARVVEPTAAEARVRGTGEEPAGTPDAAPAAAVAPAPSGPLVPLLVAGAAVAGALSMGRRRAARAVRSARAVVPGARRSP